MKNLLIILLAIASFNALAQSPTLNNIVKNNPSSPAKTGNALDAGLSWTASGTNTYAITTTTGVYSGSATYVAGDMWTINVTNANTLTTTSLNVDGDGAISLKDDFGDDLEIGVLKPGGTYKFRYNGTVFRMVGGSGGGSLENGNGTTANGSAVDLGGVLTEAVILDGDGNDIELEEIGVFRLVSDRSYLNGDDSIEVDAPKIIFNTQLPSSVSNDRIVLQSASDGELTATAKYIIDNATSSTAGGTITLDMNSQIQRLHVGSASFSTPKTIALSNTTNSLVFNFVFTITDVAAVLTLPADFKMSDVLQFDGTDWTPLSTGQYQMGGRFDGTSWLVEIAGPYN